MQGKSRDSSAREIERVCRIYKTVNTDEEVVDWFSDLSRKLVQFSVLLEVSALRVHTEVNYQYCGKRLSYIKHLVVYTIKRLRRRVLSPS